MQQTRAMSTPLAMLIESDALKTMRLLSLRPGQPFKPTANFTLQPLDLAG